MFPDTLHRLSMVFFGLLAFSAHCNQLISPLVLLVWQRELSAHVASREKGGDAVVTVQA